MVGPTAASLRDSDERLLLCATAATVRSQIYQSAFRMLGKEVATCALPELAGAIEAGEPEEAIERIVRKDLAGVARDSFDAVILSCTHYPLVKDIFARVLPPGVRIIDPGEVVAARAARNWTSETAGEGTLRFVVSQDSAPFRTLVARLFPDAPYTVEIA